MWPMGYRWVDGRGRMTLRVNEAVESGLGMHGMAGWKPNRDCHLECDCCGAATRQEQAS